MMTQTGRLMAEGSGNTFPRVALLLAVLLSWGAEALSAPVCGPGEHWIDTCEGPGAGPPWQDTFGSQLTFGVDLNLDLIGDVTARFGGPTTVHRTEPLDDSINFPEEKYPHEHDPGQPVVDGHLDVIDTDIVKVIATGIVPGLGAGTLRIGTMAAVESASLGSVFEDPVNPWLGQSFFDVFVQLDFDAFTLFNKDPLRMTGDLWCIPPNERQPSGATCLEDHVYRSFSIVPLYVWQGSYDNPGNHVANLAPVPGGAHVHKVPEPGSLVLLGLGMAALGVVRRRKAG